MLCLQIINATTAQWQWHRNAVRFQRPYIAILQCHGTSPKAGSAGFAHTYRSLTVCLSPLVLLLSKPWTQDL